MTQKSLYINIHNSIIHDCQKIDTTQTEEWIKNSISIQWNVKNSISIQWNVTWPQKEGSNNSCYKGEET